MREAKAPPRAVRPPTQRLQFRVLGPMEVAVNGRPVPLGGPKQRAVLAHLLIRRNQLVLADTLLDELWGDEPPDTARKIIQTYISHLRKAIGQERIEGGTPGYLLRLEPSELDADRFDSLQRDARKALVVDPNLAAGMFEDALALWRGHALAGLADRPGLVAEAARLDEARVDAQEGRIEALLAAGAEQRAIGEAEALLQTYPLRESLWGFLIVGLYRHGRQGDALNAFQRAREILADELGVDPSPALVRLHERILRQDPGLDLRGEALRGYRLLEKIGDGSNGSVFRTLQPHVGRDVAVKIFHEGVATDPAFVRSFERRSQAIAALEHPRIVPVYDYWREPGCAYVVSRYMRGGSLRASQARGDEADPRSVLEQVATALAFMHRRGVAHGNVSPSNVFFDVDGDAYLGDPAIRADERLDAAEDVHALLGIAQQLFPSMPAPLTELAARGNVDAAAVVEAVRVVDGSVGETPVPAHMRNPYKGLRAFSEADAHDFHGRNDVIRRLTARLVETTPGARFLAVVGPSGGGKSSVVRAGLVPAIRAGAIGGDADAWFVAETFPGRHPMDELASAIRGIAARAIPGLEELLASGSRGLLEAVDRALPPGGELVLVLDQLEEAFTLCSDPAEREHFLESLRVATADRDSRVRAIVTLRADFYDRPLVFPRFGELMARRSEALPPLTADELEQAIRAPAAGAGVATEPGLVAEMIADIAHQPGALPLLQFALTELFEHREHDRMTLDAYRETGGIAAALSRRAERDHLSLDAAGRHAAKQVFLRLVTLGEGRQDTRRRVTRRELDGLAVEPAAIDAVVETFGRDRLLTFDREPTTREPTVEIAHEALLTAWARLADWIDEGREDLRQHARLAQAAAEWHGSSQDASFLLRGGRLEQVAAWSTSTGLAIGRSERAYVRASLAERDRESTLDEQRRRREAEAERRSGRRLRALVAVLAIAALVASSLSVVAVAQRREATKRSRESFARELAAASVANLDVDPERSILLAMEAVRSTRGVDGAVLPEAENALHRAVQASRVVMTIPGSGGSLAWGDGVIMAEHAAAPGAVDVRDEATGELVRTVQAHDGDVNAIASAPDGSRFATAGEDGRLRVWDTAGSNVVTIPGDGSAVDPSFGAGGAWVAAYWPGRDIVKIADSDSGDVLRTFRGVEGNAALAPNGTSIAFRTHAGSTVLDVPTGRELAPPVVAGFADGHIAFGPNGRDIAAGGLGGAVVWNARTGEVRYPLPGHPWIDDLAWSPDGTLLATGGDEAFGVTVWRIGRTGTELFGLPSLETNSGTGGLAFSPDGTRLVAGTADGSALKVWDVTKEGDAEILNVPTIAGFGDVAFTPSGRLITADAHGHVRVWDLATGLAGEPIGPRRRLEHSFALSPDGTMIAFNDGTVWSVDTGARVLSLAHGGGLDGIGWAPGSDLLAVLGDGRTKIVDLSGETIASLPNQRKYGVLMARFSPDGRTVAAIDGEDLASGSEITIWDWEHERVVGTIRTDAAQAATFDRAGARLVTGFGAGTIWDVAADRRLVTLEGYPDPVGLAVFSPDGTRVAAGHDSGVRLFDAASGRVTLELGAANASSTVARVAFSPDGAMLASQAPGDSVRVWALDIDTLLAAAGRNVTRSFTLAECQRYLHVDACPG